jgi:hypothetical protein
MFSSFTEICEELAMIILAQLNNDREGNDCYIYEKWVLVNLFGKERILHLTSDTIDTEINITHYSLDEQPEIYRQLVTGTSW